MCPNAAPTSQESNIPHITRSGNSLGNSKSLGQNSKFQEQGSPDGLVVKNPSVNAEGTASIPGPRDPTSAEQLKLSAKPLSPSVTLL